MSQLPIDILGVIIDLLPTKIAFRTIICSTRLLQKDGLKLIKSLDFSLESLPAVRNAGRPLASDASNHIVEHLENFAKFLTSNSKNLGPIRRLDLTLQCKGQFLHATARELARVGKERVGLPHLDQLVCLIAPSLESFCVRGLWEKEMLDLSALLAALDPFRVKFIRIFDSWGFAANALECFWPALMDLTIPVASSVLSALLKSQLDNLKHLTLVCSKVYLKYLYAKLIMILDQHRRLETLSIVAVIDHGGGPDSAYEPTSDYLEYLYEEWPQHDVRKRLGSVLTINSQPIRCPVEPHPE